MLTNASGAVTRNYDYDAFGVENNKKTNDLNPFRYCGEYYDTETGNIYLRARYYDPSVGGFITEDPLRDGANWYSYCGGKPVNFFDPSGCKGYFAETMDEKNNWTNEEKQEVIADFQMLTDYKIIYDGNFIDYEIPENFCSEDAKHPMGNMLIETTLGDSIDLGIKKSNSKFYYHPEDNTIDYVPNADTQVWVEENFYTESMDGRMIKRGVLGEHPTYMRLGHELIHDFRRIKHVMFATGDLACGAYGYYRGMTYHYERIGINKEEYYTVGLDEHYNMRMSENALRKELGLPKRISY